MAEPRVEVGAQRGDQGAVMGAVVFDQGAEDAADQLPGVFDAAGQESGIGLAGAVAPHGCPSAQAVPVVVRISVPARTALVTGVFSAISASLARWSSSTPCRVISRSIHRLFRSSTT